jgi:hypothetical protein
MTVRPDHPLDALEFFLQDPSAQAASRFTTFLLDLRQRSWTLRPPELVDEQEEGSGCRNLGGVLQVYCGHPPWGDKLPVDIDAAQFRETRELLQDLCSLSREMGPFVVWFDGEEIGDIADGRIDRSLREGLLQEWERTVRSRSKPGGPTMR